MKPSDFLIEQQEPDWDATGDVLQEFPRTMLKTALVEDLRLKPQEGIADSDAAYALTKLAYSELEVCGTGGSQKLDDEEIATVLRTLRSLLKRVGIDFSPPFRDFNSFRGYWSDQNMGGSWAARRGYLSKLFVPVLAKLEEVEDEQLGSKPFRGVDGQLKNIIFASTGPKPAIVLRDAVNNVIEVTRNAEYCLFYDRPLTEAGLAWGDLVDWWRAVHGLKDMSPLDIGRNLYRRLHDAIRDNEGKANKAEKLVLDTYCERYGGDEGLRQPALLPQVYLHYDPLTRKQRGGKPSVLPRERMDFLLLLPDGVRIVIEVDGRQHYAEGDTASPRLYSEMVAEDRQLRLRGYEVFRFGGFELGHADAPAMLRGFFDELLAKYLN